MVAICQVLILERYYRKQEHWNVKTRHWQRNAVSPISPETLARLNLRSVMKDRSANCMVSTSPEVPNYMYELLLLLLLLLPHAGPNKWLEQALRMAGKALPPLQREWLACPPMVLHGADCLWLSSWWLGGIVQGRCEYSPPVVCHMSACTGGMSRSDSDGSRASRGGSPVVSYKKGSTKK